MMKNIYFEAEDQRINLYKQQRRTLKQQQFKTLFLSQIFHSTVILLYIFHWINITINNCTYVVISDIELNFSLLNCL